MQPSLSGQEASGPWMTKFPETNPLGRATYRFGGMMRRCQTTARRARNRHAGREAFPFDQIPRYLLRDRDKIFGDTFREQVRDMQIKEVLSAPRSPWQRAYIERVIGSIRRECLDHVIVFGEASLRRTLSCYFSYYHQTSRIFRRTRTRRTLGRSSHRSWDEW